jgi:hypothetical protein
MPIPNPYHRFAFSNGFAAMPPPKSPFKPSSGKLMTMFTPGNNPMAGFAQFGVGSLTENPCFRFDFQGISVGCIGQDLVCTVTVTGVQWNGTSNVDAGTKVWRISTCSQAQGCSLSEQIIDSDAGVGFTDLTAVKITAEVDDNPTSFAADDVQIGWTDTSCEAAVCRSKVRNSIMGWKRPSSPIARVRRVLRSAGRQ